MDHTAEGKPVVRAGVPAGGDDEQHALGVVLVAAAVAFVLVAGLVALLATDERPLGPLPEVVVAGLADEYLEAWAAGDHGAMAALAASPAPDFVERHREVVDELVVTGAGYAPGAPVVVGDTATVPVTTTLELGGLGTWSYETRLRLARLPGDAIEDESSPAPVWRVVWDPATIHPDLAEGRRLGRTRTWPERAVLLAVDGTPLVGEGAPRLDALAAQVLGAVGTLDEAGAAALGAPYLPGDRAGRSGLQSAHERLLAGRPSGEVVVLEGDERVAVLTTFDGAAPTPVRTTIDVHMQAAAEAALSGDRLAALVAVDVGTGDVRASVSRPTGGFNRALVGRYPPGSTFKVVTATALLAGELAPDDVVGCPATALVGGRSFSNAHGEALGDVAFRRAFSRSCNTTFVNLASDLDAADLVAVAERYGFNEEQDIGLGAAGGSFPLPEGPVEQAAAAIGQGRVTASPLQMASVAATVAAGAHRPPRLVAGDEAAPATPLPDGVAPVLQELMRQVVAEGTGAAARLDGSPVAGKTGTAEFGSARPPRTHAWFIGFRGGVAVAVVVEDGGFGGEVAAPIAADFLRRLG